MDTNVRRSSRQKKFVYGTFDQKLLGKALYGDPAYDESGRPTKKRRREVELVDVDVCFIVESYIFMGLKFCGFLI